MLHELVAAAVQEVKLGTDEIETGQWYESQPKRG